MKRLFVFSLSLLAFCSVEALAQEKPGMIGKPAGVDVKPEITRKLPEDVKSLRADPETRSGPGNLVKHKEDRPTLGKNINTGAPGLREKDATNSPKKPNGDKVLNPTQTEDEVYVGVKRTTGDEGSSGPGDKFKKKGAAPGGKNARSGSDEGGDIEDLELQR